MDTQPLAVLQGVTKEYGADIIVGEGTRNSVSDVVFRELDRVRVKGEDVAVTIFEPIALEGEVDGERLEEIRVFHQMLELLPQPELGHGRAEIA